MKYFRLQVLIIILICIASDIAAQRFSLLVEAGPLRGQVDGDKLQGFFYNGFTAGIGSNITLTNAHFVSIKTSYYSQGSRRQEVDERGVFQNLQLATDLQTIGLEMSYKYRPIKDYYTLGFGLVRHQIANLEYEVFSKPLLPGDDERVIKPNQLKSGFTSLKLYSGLRVFPRGEVYFALESSLTNLLNFDFFEIESLVPYSLAAIFTYEIVAPKEVKKRSRSGYKVRPIRKN